MSALRRKLRRVDPAIKAELSDVVLRGLEAIQRDAQALVPVDTGDLRDSIEVQFSKRDGISGLVGPGAKAAEIVRRKSTTKSAFGDWKFRLSKKNKARLYEFFKGYWIEFGTKGNAKKNIPAQPARPFMAPAYLANRAWIAEKARIAVDRVLVRISGE